MYLFKRIICFCLCWVFVAAYRLALVVASRELLSRCGACTLKCWALVIEAGGLSSCGLVVT